MDYVFFVLTVICIWSIMSLATNLVLGYTGLFTVGHAAYLAVGAYTAGILNIFFGVNYFLTLPIAMLATAAVAAVTLLPLLRLGPFHFGLATLGLNVVAIDVIHNVAPRVRGAEGLFGLQVPGFMIAGPGRFIVVALLTAVATAALWRIVHSPFGRSLRAVRDRPEAFESVGKDPQRFRLLSWTLSGAFAGLAGALYAVTLFYIDPTVFVVTVSFFLLVYIGVGGLASVLGCILGPLLLIAFSEGLRFTGLSSDVAGPIQQVLYGGLLIALMLFRRRGLVGTYEFRE